MVVEQRAEQITQIDPLIDNGLDTPKQNPYRFRIQATREQITLDRQMAKRLRRELSKDGQVPTIRRELEVKLSEISWDRTIMQKELSYWIFLAQLRGFMLDIDPDRPDHPRRISQTMERINGRVNGHSKDLISSQLHPSTLAQEGILV